jgi:hypothetical protein
MRIERFALTANNITYGVLGEMLGYWDFFPAPDRDAGWGRIPAMGWAEVIASRADGVEPGGRYYGWFPMARYCGFLATAGAQGLRDDSPYRSEQAPVYRSYLETGADPLYEPGPETEDRHALLRGLFATGFVIDAALADADYYGASTAIVLSASSKTAIAYAQRAGERGLPEVIGLTSARNRDFVEGLDLYSRVLSYGEEDSIEASDSVLVDMAGNGEVLERVHSQLGGQLKHSMIVGMSHHDAERGEVSAGPRPELFFAPTEIAKLVAHRGAEEYQRRLAAALSAFVTGSESWLQIERSNGPEAALAAYHAVLDGSTPPSVGRIVSLH